MTGCALTSAIVRMGDENIEEDESKVIIKEDESKEITWEDESNQIIWSCIKNSGKENSLWLVEWGDKSYIRVFDGRIDAHYSMEGIRKRWSWGSNRAFYGYDYSVTLNSDGRADYFDFDMAKGGIAKSSATYKCSKQKPRGADR